MDAGSRNATVGASVTTSAELLRLAAPSLSRYRGPAASPVVSKGATVGRNQPCPCGSGKKFKKCCLAKTRPQRHVRPREMPTMRPVVAGADISQVSETPPQSSEEVTATAMLRIGVPDDVVWAYLETGLYITDANKGVQPADDVARWEAAKATYGSTEAKEKIAGLRGSDLPE